MGGLPAGRITAVVAVALAAATGCQGAPGAESPVRPGFSVVAADPPSAGGALRSAPLEADAQAAPKDLLLASPLLPPVGAAPFPAPAPTPSPEPSQGPRAFRGAYFAVTYPPTWQLASADEPEVIFALVSDRADGRLVVAEYPADANALKSWTAREVARAGDGLVASGATVIDEVRGAHVTSNQLPAIGPRYVRAFAFVYRSRLVTLTVSWDKLDADADAVRKEVDALIRAWRWI